MQGKRNSSYSSTRRIQISSSKDREGLIVFVYAADLLMLEMCRASGLMRGPGDCPQILDPSLVLRILEMQLRSNRLSCLLPIFGRISRSTDGWPKGPWHLGWLAGSESRRSAKDNSDSYLPKQIVSSGLVWSSFVDEFHPALVIVCTAVERLVCNLVLLKRRSKKIWGSVAHIHFRTWPSSVLGRSLLRTTELLRRKVTILSTMVLDLTKNVQDLI